MYFIILNSFNLLDILLVFLFMNYFIICYLSGTTDFITFQMHFKRFSLFYIVCLSTVDECTFLHDNCFTERVHKELKTQHWIFSSSAKKIGKKCIFCVDLINGLFWWFLARRMFF